MYHDYTERGSTGCSLQGLEAQTSSRNNTTRTSDNLQGLSSRDLRFRSRLGQLLIFTSSRTPLHGWLILIEIWGKEV